MMADELLKNAYLLVLANKSDFRYSLTPSQVLDGLNLRALGDRKWYIQRTVAVTGQGLFEGLDWVSRAVGA
jgi:signal recognition particle receptor subunit beta